MKNRPQITVGELFAFIEKYGISNKTLLYCAPSEMNIDEPEETQEFILDEEKRKCVAVQLCLGEVTIGYEE